jgi:hypothetical protein
MGLRRQNRRTSVIVSPWTIALVVVAAAWLSHMAEYLRVYGWNSFGSAASRQVHTYMGPVGIALLLLAMAGVQVGLRSFRRLERRLVGLTNGSVDPAAPSPRVRRFEVPLVSLLSLVWMLQVALYIVQENAELQARHISQPVLGVVTGTHAWAPLVHLVVAAALIAVVWLAHRPLAELAELVRQVVAWLVATGRRALSATSPVATVRSWTPAERFGGQLWSRPPPAALAD